MPTLILSSDYRWAGPAMRVSAVPPNNRFARSRGSIFGDAKEGVDDSDKAASFDADAAPRRSTSSLGNT